MTSERLFNSFIHPQKLLYPPKTNFWLRPWYIHSFSQNVASEINEHCKLTGNILCILRKSYKIHRIRSKSETNFKTLIPKMIVLYVIVLLWTADGRLNVNVALNRPSYASSEWSYDMRISKGNDGDKSNCDVCLIGHSVTASHIEINPWYSIDLGVKLVIAGVNLTHRADYVRPGKWLLPDSLCTCIYLCRR